MSGNLDDAMRLPTSFDGRRTALNYSIASDGTNLFIVVPGVSLRYGSLFHITLLGDPGVDLIRRGAIRNVHTAWGGGKFWVTWWESGC
jgi:hypothetical protein